MQYFHMMTSSNGNIFRGSGPLCGEFTDRQWIPRTKTSDAELWCFFYLRLNKRLSKQWWGWWFKTPSRSLWRHCNELLCPCKRKPRCDTAALWHRRKTSIIFCYTHRYMLKLATRCSGCKKIKSRKINNGTPCPCSTFVESIVSKVFNVGFDKFKVA